MSCIIFVFCRRNLAKLLKQQQAESANDKDSTTSDSTLAPDAANEHTSTKSVENGVSKKSASRSLVSSSKHQKGSSNGELVSGRMSRRESEFEFVDLQENPETEIYFEEGSLEQAGKCSRYMYQKSNLVDAIETTTKAQTTETGSDKTTLLINNTKVTAEVIEPKISRPATLAIPGSASAATKESVAASKLSVVYAEPVKMRNCATTPRSGTVDNRKTFVAMYPIDSTSDGQLDLAINDVIFFMEEEQDGWMKGEKKESGEVGWFPKSHVREGVSKLPDTAMFESPYVSTPTSTPAAAAAAAAASSRTSYVLQQEESIDSTDEEFEEEETCGVECLAVYPYQALQDGDLSFEAGDVVFVVEMNENGWWKGYHGDEEGFFPGSYVQIMPNNDQSTVDGSLLQSEFNLTKSEMRLSAESPEEAEPLTLKQKRKLNNKTISKFFSKRLTHLNPSLLFAKSTGEVKTKQLRKKKKRRNSQTATDRSQAPEPPALPGSAEGDDSPAKSKALIMDIVGQIADKHKRKDGGLKAATPTDQTASLTTKPDSKSASKTKESKTKDGGKMKASKKSSKPTIAQLFKQHPPSSEYDDSNSNIGNAGDNTATDVNGFNSGVYANLDEFVKSSDTSPTTVNVPSSQTDVHTRGGTAHLFVKNSRLSRSTENLTSIGGHLDVWKPNKADAPDHRFLKPLPPQKPQKQKGNELNSDDQSGMSRTTSFPDLIRAEVETTPTADQPSRTKPQPPLKKPVLGDSNAGARRVTRNQSMNALSSELVAAKPQPLTKKPKLPQMTSTNHFRSEIALSAGRSGRDETEEEFPSLLRSKREEEILAKRLKRSNSDRSSVKPKQEGPEVDLGQHQTEVIRLKLSPSLEDFARAKFGEESFA